MEDLHDKIFKTRAPLYEKLLKLRDFEDDEHPHLRERYERSFKKAQMKAGISDEDLKKYEVFKLKEEAKAKLKINEKARVIEGIKFKNREELREWLMQHSIGFQIKFFFKAFWNALTGKSKTQKQ